MKLTDLLSQRNNENRGPDFSHMFPETVEEYIKLKLKNTLTKEEEARLEEIDKRSRYLPNGR